MNHNEWYKYAYVDYFSSFLKLRIAFNSWYEQNYIKSEVQQKRLKEWYNALKSQQINPYEILKSKWIIDEENDKIILKDLSIQKKDEFLNQLKEVLEEKALEFWHILVIDKLWDRNYVIRVWEDHSQSLVILMDDIEYVKNLHELKVRIQDLYQNDKKVDFKDEQIEDITRFISNIIVESELNINYTYADLWAKQETDFETPQDYRVYCLLNNVKHTLPSDSNLLTNIASIVEINKPVDWKTNILFLEWFDLKAILLIIYFVRNKLIHWEIDPANDKHYAIIKLCFYIMDDIFRSLTK